MKKQLAVLMTFSFLLVSVEAGAQSIDGVPIGSTLPSTGKFTNLEATTQITLGAETITNFSGLDDDKVKVSSGDTSDFLESQIVGGTGVSVNSDGSQITISAPPVNVEDSADGVEITFARESESVIDLNGTALFIGSTDPTVTLGGQARTVLSKGTIPNTTPALQQVVVELPFALLGGSHKLKLTNTSGFSEGLIPLSSIGNDEFVTLLLHADGTGNTFTDSSSPAKTITAVGNATQSSTQSQFGGKSAFFDGAGDYLSVPDSDDWDFGSGDFTVETWMKTSDSAGMIVGNATYPATNGGWGLFHFASGFNKIAFQYWSGNGWRNLTTNSLNVPFSTSSTNDDNWHHVAVVRSGSSLMMFVDGDLKQTVTPLSIDNGTTALQIGSEVAELGGSLEGYLDEVRISKGIARWTANFTPPTAPYN